MDRFFDPAFLTLLGMGVGLIAGVIGLIALTSKIYDKVILSRRLQQLSGTQTNMEEVSIMLEESNERVDIVLSRLLPSLNKTNIKFRQVGMKMSIRVYVLILLFIAGFFSLVVPMPFIPQWGKPILMLVGLHFFFEHVILKKISARRKEKIIAEMPSALDYMVRSIKTGGQGLEKAIQQAAETAEPPLKRYLEDIVQLVKTGASLEEAMDLVASEIQLREFDFFVALCKAQSKTGGNLGDVLATLSETIRSRHHLRLKIAAMASEGLVSAYLLSALPFVMLGFLSWTRPDYVELFFNSEVGNQLLALTIGLVVLAYFWIKRIVSFKV